MSAEKFLNNNHDNTALICGSGELPIKIANKLINNKNFLIICIVDNAQILNVKHFESFMHFKNLSKIGDILNTLKINNIKNIIFAGGVKRPSLSWLNLDDIGLKWLKQLGKNFFKGDDSLLKGIIKILNNEGFNILDVRDVLDDATCTSDQVLTSVMPNENDILDINRGIDILNALAIQDIAQACIIENGLVLGIETIGGTDQLINDAARNKRDSNNQSGVLVKQAKTNQNTLIDLPVIGIETLRLLKSCNFKGLAIAKNSTLMLDKELLIDFSNKNNIFIKVF